LAIRFSFKYDNLTIAERYYVFRGINHSNGHVVINPASLTMLMILFISILINLVILPDQCEFALSQTNLP